MYYLELGFGRDSGCVTWWDLLIRSGSCLLEHGGPKEFGLAKMTIAGRTEVQGTNSASSHNSRDNSQLREERQIQVLW